MNKSHVVIQVAKKKRYSIKFKYLEILWVKSIHVTNIFQSSQSEIRKLRITVYSWCFYIVLENLRTNRPGYKLILVLQSVIPEQATIKWRSVNTIAMPKVKKTLFWCQIQHSSRVWSWKRVQAALKIIERSCKLCANHIKEVKGTRQRHKKKPGLVLQKKIF